MIHKGKGLEEGKVYITRGKPFKCEDTGRPVYYIEGLGQKLCCRFTELLEEEEDSAEKMISKLKEEFELN